MSAHLEKSFKKQGMTIHTATGLEKLEVSAGGVKASIKAKDGTVTVVAAGPELKILAKNKLPDQFTASPAIS